LDRTLNWNRAICGERCVSTSGITTGTEPADRSLARHPCEAGLSLSNLLRSNASPLTDMIFSAESCTSTAMRLDLRGRSFRHAQRLNRSTFPMV
jgi:hypothetical protein